MRILPLLKHDLADIRNKMARDYRIMRQTDRTKARVLFRRMRAAMAVTEQALQTNLLGPVADKGDMP